VSFIREMAFAAFDDDPVTWSLTTHREKRFTRLSFLVPSGTLSAIAGRLMRLLPMMPLINPVSVFRCPAKLPFGSSGYSPHNPSRTARNRQYRMICRRATKGADALRQQQVVCFRLRPGKDNGRECPV